MRPLSFSRYANDSARACAIALGFAIPISVALDNVLLAIIALAWLLDGHYRNKFEEIRTQPVCQAALVLFGLLLMGLLYGERNPGDGVGYLLKYVDLVFVPVFVTLFRDERTRELALKAFCGAIILDIVISYMAYDDLLYLNPVLHRMREFPTGFKSTITHSLFVCFTAFLLVLLARQETRRWWRIVYIALALIAAHNVVFIVLSRTGYLVLALLALYYFVVTFGRRGILAAAVVAIVAFGTAYTMSHNFHKRLTLAVSEFSTWHAGKPADTSVGLRMEFYRGALAIVQEHPVLGDGTGSFPLAYAKAVGGHHMIATANPHDEYLLITTQIGLVGLAAMLFLFWQQWRYAGRMLYPLYRDLGRGLVIVFAAGCLFNSLLLDHAEGLFFAWMTGLVFSAPRKLDAALERNPP